MDHQADVRLVYAHAERNSGDDDRDPVSDEVFLGAAAGLAVQPGVVRAGRQSLLVQVLGQLLGFPAGEAVDDGGLVRPLPEQRQQQSPGVRFGLHRIAQVASVEAGQKDLPPLQVKLADDVLAHLFGGSGGQGNHRDRREFLTQQLQIPVVGAKLVAPFGDAVGLVDGDEVQVEVVQEMAEPGQGQPLRGRVQNFDLPPEDLALHPFDLRRRKGTVDEPGGDAIGVQRVHLVLHEGDQRRYDQSEAVKDQGRQLVAEGLAAAGGHQHQAVPAGQDVPDDVRLERAKAVVPEPRLEDSQRRVSIVHRQATPHLTSQSPPAGSARPILLPRPVGVKRIVSGADHGDSSDAAPTFWSAIAPHTAPSAAGNRPALTGLDCRR